MREFYKLLIVGLSVCSLSFPQISDITRLSVQNPSQSIKESAPVWLSENEILIFYVSETLDTIYSTKSTDRGISWNEPETIQVIDPYIGTFLTSVKTSTGRILLAWSVFSEGIYQAYSDDNGESWSQARFIEGSGLVDLSLSELDDGRIILSYVHMVRQTAYFRESTNNGATWSTNTKSFQLKAPLRIYDLSINSLNSSTLLATFSTQVNLIHGIYKCLSYDDGETWTDTIRILNTDLDETRPKIIKKESNEYLLAYLVEETIWFGGEYKQNDIFYLKSSDNGETWIDKTRFTKYIGQDEYLNISVFSDKTFLTFSTERFTNDLQISYAILEETVEISTPPKIFEYGVPEGGIDLENREFIYQVKVLDDEAIEEVALAINDSVYKYELYDDGMHEDELAEDGIYGNILPIIEQEYTDKYRMEVNKILLPMNNRGVLADVGIQKYMNVNIKPLDNNGNITTAEDVIYYENLGSGGLYDEGSFLFDSGFFLSGLLNGELWANGVSTVSNVETYQPGRAGSNPEDPVNALYIVRSNDLPFNYSWQKWKDAVNLGANYYDGDKNGIYNPVDKNYNGTWDQNEDMPPLIGDEVVWCVYNDGVPAGQRRFGFEAEPLGIEIQQTLFASNISDLENVVFIKYKITNTGLVNENLDSVFFSPRDDTDLGNPTDDLGGCDTLLNSMFTYNGNADGVYGDNPPAIFTTLLQGPVLESEQSEDTAYIRFGQLIGEQVLPGFKNLDLYSFTGYAKSDPNQGDPYDIYHVRNYVYARDRHGNLLDPCEPLYGQVLGNIDCSLVNPMYWFSGDPVINEGWLDRLAMDDRKFSSMGPFTLEKDKPVEIILALIVGRGTDYTNSITVGRENVQRAIAEYESNFTSMTYTPPPPTNPVNNYILYQNYPNPFNPVTTIKFDLPKYSFVEIIIFDILGKEIATLVNEKLSAGSYSVDWIAINYPSGVYFYKLVTDEYVDTKKMVLLK